MCKGRRFWKMKSPQRKVFLTLMGFSGRWRRQLLLLFLEAAVTYQAKLSMGWETLVAEVKPVCWETLPWQPLLFSVEVKFISQNISCLKAYNSVCTFLLLYNYYNTFLLLLRHFIAPNKPQDQSPCLPMSVSLEPLGNTGLPSVSVDLPILDILCKWLYSWQD